MEYIFWWDFPNSLMEKVFWWNSTNLSMKFDFRCTWTQKSMNHGFWWHFAGECVFYRFWLVWVISVENWRSAGQGRQDTPPHPPAIGVQSAGTGPDSLPQDTLEWVIWVLLLHAHLDQVFAETYVLCCKGSPGKAPGSWVGTSYNLLAVSVYCVLKWFRKEATHQIQFSALQGHARNRSESKGTRRHITNLPVSQGWPHPLSMALRCE